MTFKTFLRGFPLPIATVLVALAIILLIPACISTTTSGQSSAAGGFTASSAVTEWPSGDLYIGVEAVIPAGKLSIYRFPFEVPLGKTILQFDGDIAFRAGCYAQALTSIQFEGAGEYTRIQKLPIGGGSSNLDFNPDVPITTRSTKANIKIESDPVSPCPGDTTVEIAGTLEIEK